MNRWLRVLGVVFVLMSANSAVFAVCDAELNRAISQYKVVSTDDYGRGLPQTNYDFIMKNGPQMQLEVLRFKIKENEKSINEASRERGMHPLARVYIAQLQNCLYELQISKKISNSNPQTTEALPAQQPQQQNQSQDELVTGPKEDCVALLKGVKAEQMYEIHVACLKRNGSRDRNAARANTQKQAAETPQRSDQSAQQKAQQAQQQAQQSQARADQARQGKRRQHEAENEASQCLALSNDGAMFGGFTNSCGYKVEFMFCNYKPKKGSWADSFNCQEKYGIGAWQVGANGKSVDHTNRNGMTYWFACKSPATPLDGEFVEGQGLRGRCYTVGGN